jgi:DNA-directed RNA polymerase sigma subunit (sigma70/sigma32)
VAQDAELAEAVSMAMLLVLETLTPAERAVFVLREVFDVAYEEIADAVGKTPAAVRQIAHRARAHVAARRPRGTVSAAQTRDALEAFRRAAQTGDLRGLLAGMGRITAAVTMQRAQVNGYPALILRLDGELDTVIAVRIDEGLISGLYAVRNPEKLSRMARETTLRR